MQCSLQAYKVSPSINDFNHFGWIPSETNKETTVIIPLDITVLFQIKMLVTYVK